MFRFESPLFLFLILLLPLIWYFKERQDQGPMIRVSSLFGSHAAQPSIFIILYRFLPAIRYLALALMIIALARPQYGIEKMRVKTEGVNIILALDLSESMSALDFKLDGKIVTRLDAVKAVVKSFIMKRDGDRIGMVVFGSQAYTQIPLTRDYNTIAFMLDRLEIGAAGPRTAIGDAIGISLKRLEDVESKSNIIILLTDGKSNSGELSPTTAAGIAKERGIKIYTIGVGQQGTAPFRVVDPIFGERYVQQRVDIDYDTLEQIAKMTSGQFYRASDTQTLNTIYQQVDSLETTEKEVTTWADYQELYFNFLLTGFVLLSLCIILSNTRLLRVP